MTPTTGTNSDHSPAVDARRNAESPTGSKCRPDCVTPTPAQAHCSVCHRTFGGVSRFDAHRDNGRCADPATLDMVETNGVWRTPMDEATVARLRGEVAE